MLVTDSTIDNPFPAEAVARFGPPGTTCDTLGYYTLPREELNAYLSVYGRSGMYGGAIALSGRQGAGKTHLLSWLGQEFAKRKTIRGTTLYAKCDSNSIFDIYRSLMRGLERPQLIGIIQLALLNLARKKVQAARITEGLVERLETVGELQVLEREGNLDLEQLTHELVELIDASSAGSNKLARVLLDVPTSRHGIDAYHWLTGTVLERPTDLGVVDAMGAGSPIGEVNAIAALEAIAALHRIAGVPLLVLVDQLEVLVQTRDAAVRNRLAVHVKDLAESLGKQSALLFMAGMPHAWESFPTDVTPRFRRAGVVPVGNITVAECALLVEAYRLEQHGVKPFSGRTIEVMNRLTAGSPRDVLRTAHECFKLVGAELGEVDERVLLRSARSAGSLELRSTQALTAIDAAMDSFGQVSRGFRIGDTVVDRALVDAEGRIDTVVMILQATDALEEVAVARRVRNVQSACQALEPVARLVVVSVGYSSSDVTSLLPAASTATIAYDDASFVADFNAALQRVRQVTPPAPAAPTSPSADSSSTALERTLKDSLDGIASRLDQLEMARRESAERVSERLVASTAALAGPVLAAERLSTRRHIMDTLESLEELVHQNRPAEERMVVRSIMVSNEGTLRLSELDEIGGLYLDVLSATRSRPWDERLVELRHELVRRMHATLRQKPRLIPVLTRLRVAGPITVVVLVAWLAAVYVSWIARAEDASRSVRELGDLQLPLVVGALGTLWFYILLLGYVWTNRDKKRLQRELEELRDSAKLANRFGNKIHDVYPQSL